MMRAACGALAAAAAISAAAVPANAATFTGLVQERSDQGVVVFDPDSKRSIPFVVPPAFHGVSSTDGYVRDATLQQVPPEMRVRVTYHMHRNRNEIDALQMLTRDACRALENEPVPHPRGSGCPD